MELLYRYIIHELHSTLKIYTLEKKRERGGGLRSLEIERNKFESQYLYVERWPTISSR